MTACSLAFFLLAEAALSGGAACCRVEPLWLRKVVLNTRFANTMEELNRFETEQRWGVTGAPVGSVAPPVGGVPTPPQHQQPAGPHQGPLGTSIAHPTKGVPKKQVGCMGLWLSCKVGKDIGWGGAVGCWLGQ